MKKLMITALIFFFAGLASASAQDWKESFYNDVISYNYEIAVENALQSDVSVEEIVSLSSELGYDSLYISAQIYSVSEKLISRGSLDQEMRQVLDNLYMAGIDPGIIERSTGLTQSDLESAVNTGEIHIPGQGELAMNYERFYGVDAGDAEENSERMQTAQNNQAEDQEQGLGFGDAPGLGLGGNLAMYQFNFGFGGNIGNFASPSAP